MLGVRIALGLAATFLFASAAPSQVFTLSPNVNPGEDIALTMLNTTSSPIFINGELQEDGLRIFNCTGELLYAADHKIMSGGISPTKSESFKFRDAELPFGSLRVGHYVIECVYRVGIGPRETIALSLTVGAPTSPPPTFITVAQEGISPYPRLDAPPALRIINVTDADHFFDNASWVRFLHGHDDSIDTGTLPTLSIKAGRSQSLPWPGGSHQTRDVQELLVFWDDPVIGSVGDTITVAPPARFDSDGRPLFAFLHRPWGEIVPNGHHLDVVVQTSAPPTCLFGCGPVFLMTPTHMALAVSASTGALKFENGAVLFHEMDDLLIESIQGNLSAVIHNSPGLTVAVNHLPWPGRVGPVRIVHPGPAFSGFNIFASGIGYDPNGGHWQASPVYRIVLG